jgi:predicted transcriptional regulator
MPKKSPAKKSKARKPSPRSSPRSSTRKPSKTGHAVPVSITLPPKLLERLDQVAEVYGWPRSKVVALALSEYLQTESALVEIATDQRASVKLRQIFQSPEIVRAIARAMGEELSEKQIQQWLDYAPAVESKP